jgi:hypothetical protein
VEEGKEVVLALEEEEDEDVARREEMWVRGSRRDLERASFWLWSQFGPAEEGKKAGGGRGSDGMR